MKIKEYGNVVEGPMGFQMPESVAAKIEELSNGLPKDFVYRRHGFKTAITDRSDGDRTEVSIISTDAVDRDGDVVIPLGGDWSGYNKTVPYSHNYGQLPAGFSHWIKSHGLKELRAKTEYPVKPADWGDVPWMPSAVWHMINQPVPTLGDKSIGFIPLNIRSATSDEKALRPEMKDSPVIDRWAGLEYSVVAIPCNSEVGLVSIGKMLKGVEPELAELFAETFKIDLKTIAEPAEPGETPEAKAAREREEKIAAALSAPFYTAEQRKQMRERQMKELEEWAKAESWRQITDAFVRAAGVV